jgi:hypothetical protein
MQVLQGLTRQWAVSPISTNHPCFKFHKGQKVSVECQDPAIEFEIVERVEGLAWPHYIVTTSYGAQLRVSQLELSRYKRPA